MVNINVVLCYNPPVAGLVATPAQALCDFVYLACRKGVDPRSLVTFRRLDQVASDEMARLITRYPGTVATAIRRIHP